MTDEHSPAVPERPVFEVREGAAAVMRSSDLDARAAGANVVVMPGAAFVVLPDSATAADVVECLRVLSGGARQPDPVQEIPRTL